MGAINSSDPMIAAVTALLGGWLVFAHPAVFIGLLCGFIVIMFWLLPKLWRGIKLVLGNIGRVTQI
jgi:hypothetical protein